MCVCMCLIHILYMYFVFICVYVWLLCQNPILFRYLNRFPNTMECECELASHTAIRLIIQSKFVCFIRVNFHMPNPFTFNLFS